MSHLEDRQADVPQQDGGTKRQYVAVTLDEYRARQAEVDDLERSGVDVVVQVRPSILPADVVVTGRYGPTADEVWNWALHRTRPPYSDKKISALFALAAYLSRDGDARARMSIERIPSPVERCHHCGIDEIRRKRDHLCRWCMDYLRAKGQLPPRFLVEQRRNSKAG